MGSTHSSFAARGRARASGVLAIALLTSCRTPHGATSTSLPAPALAHAVTSAATLRSQTFPSGKGAGEAAASALLELDALVVAGGPRPPREALDQAALAAIRAFVDRGGRVLLLGHGLALAHDLGLDDRAPDVRSTFRWGFDSRTAEGRAKLGFQLVSGRAPELVAGMQSAPQREHAFYLCGGAPVDAALCLYSAGPPAQGEVLGQLALERDGQGEVQPAAVLIRWTCGEGAVLGLGLEPDVIAPDAVLAQNGNAFVQKASEWLLRDRATAQVGYWLLPGSPQPAALLPLPELLDREVPGAPLLAHWGIVAAVHDRDTRGLPSARTPEQVLESVMLPAYAAGASVLSLDVVDREQGLPLPWGEADPLAKPKDYRGSAFATGWSDAGVERITHEAHARGMLVEALLDSTPFGQEKRVRLASLRFLGREWADVRRLHDGAIDGVALREWFDDERGLGTAMLQDFQPAVHVTRVGEGVPVLSGGIGALDARDGRPSQLRAFGIVDGWRDGFPAERFPLGYLDCTPVTLPLAFGETAPTTGGSYPDWIAQQAVDFVRTRRLRGGAMLWQSQRPAALASDTLAYVHGVSSEPLVAAVAARCTATGLDGYRSAQRALLPEVHADFAQTVPAGAAVVQLRNNHVRLLGSGGVLELDNTGLARFGSSSSNGASSAVRIADSFVRTRFFGGRPDAEELRTLELDLLGGGRRGEGGYAFAFPVQSGSQRTRSAVPSQLAFGEAPRWPQQFDFTLPRETGRFDLRLRARALRGRGVLAVAVDGAVLTMLPFADARLSIDATVPVHFAHGKARSLQFEILDGGALAFDRCELVRAGDVAAEAEVLVPAGSYASLRERSSSTYHQEKVEIATIADFPGFLLRAECERAVRSLQQERRFGLLHHRTLRTASSGESVHEMRKPFVLASDDPTLPDLAVVPLRLSRYEHFRLQDGELTLSQMPEANARTAIGFVFVAKAKVQAMLPHLERLLMAIERPASLVLTDEAQADLQSDLPIAWTRVLSVQQAQRSPFMVRERGWWTWRGVQCGEDGGSDYLRIHHLPGDTVQIVGGHALLARTRPGKGSLATVALKDPTPTSVTVRVLQRSPLHAPAVTMATAFDEVFVDGQSWANYDGRTVTLPNREATYAVTTRTHSGAVAPHVLTTGADLQHCTFDAETKELVLVAAADPERPTDLPFTAVIAGPMPSGIEGGAFVDERDLRHQDPSVAARVRSAGVVIRFRAGIVRVKYDQ